MGIIQVLLIVVLKPCFLSGTGASIVAELSLHLTRRENDSIADHIFIEKGEYIEKPCCKIQLCQLERFVN